MKLNKLFWGFLLITAGVVMLVEKIFNFDIQLGWAVDLWPLILILWGVTFLKIPDVAKKVSALLAGLTFALVVVGMFSCERGCGINNEFNWRRHGNHEFKGSFYHKLDMQNGIKTADFEIKSAAGSIYLNDTSSSLVEVNAMNLESELTSDTTEDGKTSITLDAKGGFSSGKKREVNLKLNKNVVWNLNFNSGVSSIKCDLIKFKIDTINISSGASSMYLLFGKEKDTINLIVDSGVSNLKIDIPNEFSVRIASDLALSKFNMKDFYKVDEDIYLSNNFGKTNKVVFINFDGALSNLDINRY